MNSASPTSWMAFAPSAEMTIPPSSLSGAGRLAADMGVLLIKVKTAVAVVGSFPGNKLFDEPGERFFCKELIRYFHHHATSPMRSSRSHIQDNSSRVPSFPGLRKCPFARPSAQCVHLPDANAQAL